MSSGQRVSNAASLVNIPAFAILSIAIAVLTPVAGLRLVAAPSFLPAFFTAAFTASALTAYLLVQKFLVSGSPRTLALATAYVWTALIVVPNALTYPGLASPSGLWGSSAQTVVWLWFAWHGLFPLLLAAACVPWPTRLDDLRLSPTQRRHLVAAVLVATAAITVVITLLATAGASHFPRLISNDDYSAFSRRLGPATIAVNVAALIPVAWGLARLRGAEHWVLVAAAASVGDTLLTTVAVTRWSVGWYAGRVLSLVAAAVVLMALLREIVQLYRLHARDSAHWRKQASTDLLTGISNRAAILEEAALMVAAAPEQGLYVVVALADLDHFKQVNDLHGHLAGDHVLVATARCLKGALRQSDRVGRYGGEEFLILATVREMEHAAQVAQRLLSALHAEHVPVPGGTVALTMSVGVAIHRLGDTLEETIARADEALYTAKRAGRDRWVTWEPATAVLPRAEGEDRPHRPAPAHHA